MSLAAAAVLTASSAFAATTPLGADFRISNAGTDDDIASQGITPAVASNPDDGEYLVVWRQTVSGQPDIFGQLMGAGGNEIGSDFPISNVGAAGAAQRPAVAYNSTESEYLVVWEGKGPPAAGEIEVFGQRVNADGTEDGTDFRISNVGAEGVTTRGVSSAAVAFNSTTNEYLVVWRGDDLGEDDYEIQGQRLNADGSEDGVDTAISLTSPAGATREADFPSVAYNSTQNEYLVTWEADAGATAGEIEVWRQRLNVGVGQIGGNVQISNVGPDGDATRSARSSSVVYDSTSNQFLVVWEANALVTPGEVEIWGQVLNAAGAELTGELRISTVGAETDHLRDPRDPSIAYNPTTDEYLVSWSGDGLDINDEEEIFSQRLSAAGNELGTDTRISSVGADDNPARDAIKPAIAVDPTANAYLVAWDGNDLDEAGEHEIWGRLLGEPPPAELTPPAGNPVATSPLAAPPAPPSEAVKCKKGQKLKKGKCVKKKRKK